MSRPPKNQIATKEFHRALNDLKKRRPPRRPLDVTLWGHKEFDVEITDETIRRALVGEVDPTGCQIELLFMLAQWFDATPEELGSHAAERMHKMQRLMGQNPPPGLQVQHSRWSNEHGGQSLATVTLLRAASGG